MKQSKLVASLTVVILTLMLTVSAVPMALAVEEDDQQIEATAGIIDDGTVGAIKWWLRVLPVTSSIMGIYDYYSPNDRFDIPAGSGDTIKEFARDVDAQRSAEQQYNLLMVASDLVRNDTQTWKLTDAYLNRAAEIAAGTLWYSGATFDGDGILEYAGVYDAIANGNLNTQDVLDRAVKVSVDLRDDWDSTNYGQALNIRLIWDGGNTGNATSALYADFCTLVTATSDANIVYLTQSGDEFTTAENSTIWAYTNSGSLTPLAGGTTISLAKGANDVSALPSGFYRLTPGTYGGPFLQSVSANAAPTKGVMGIVCDESYGYVMSDGDNVKIWWNDTLTTSATLDYEITGCSNPQTSHGSPFALVNSYAAYMDQLTDLLYESTNAAQTMWTISAQVNTSNILLSPSALIPHLANVGITPEQSYAMYVLALDQISQYNANYGSILKDGMTKISAQSLDLYCHGSVYAADGTVLADNVIFTPYIYLKDWSIFSGRNNTFSQDGIIMIWDTADSAADWTIPSATGYDTLVVTKGAYILPDEIYYGGEEVSSVHLDVKEIQRIAAFEDLDFERADTPKVLDASTLIMIIIIELGLIIGLLGYIIRTPAMIGIGFIVIVVGAVASKFIAALLLGGPIF